MNKILALAGLMTVLVALPVAAQPPVADEHHPGAAAAAPTPKGDQPAPPAPAQPGTPMAMGQCPMMASQGPAGAQAQHRESMMSRMMAMMTGRKDDHQQMAQAGPMCMDRAMPMAPPNPAAPPTAPAPKH